MLLSHPPVGVYLHCRPHTLLLLLPLHSPHSIITAFLQDYMRGHHSNYFLCAPFHSGSASLLSLVRLHKFHNKKASSYPFLPAASFLLLAALFAMDNILFIRPSSFSTFLARSALYVLRFPDLFTALLHFIPPSIQCKYSTTFLSHLLSFVHVLFVPSLPFIGLPCRSCVDGFNISFKYVHGTEGLQNDPFIMNHIQYWQD